MEPMQRRSLEWLNVLKMHLQEKTLFDPDLAVNITQNVALYPLHLQSLKLLRPTVWEKLHLQKNTLFDHDLGLSWPVTLYIM